MVSYKKRFFWEWAKGPLFLLAVLGGQVTRLAGKNISTHGTEKIEEMICPSIVGAGYDLIRIKFSDEHNKTLQIMIERRDRGLITVDDCAIVSRLVSPLLDVGDPVPNSYTLEVSSPGIDRPLVKVEDFERFVGFKAAVETKRPIYDRKKFRGLISSVIGNSIRIEINGKYVDLPFEEIRQASLIITDELIEASRREASAASRMEH